ncbi:hypothetical protein [Brachybacterium nesterenkovii]|uniref:hypothetical protein n=1 Tax=Brachybacterium nesterenkovii TaxID=47847 RepID=UPI0032198EF4
MSTGWYLQADGDSHRLYIDAEARDEMTGPGTDPATVSLTWGTVDGSALSTLVASCAHALAHDGPAEDVVASLALAVGDEAGKVQFLARSARVAIGGELEDACSSRQQVGVPLSLDGARRLIGAPGPAEVLLGADEDWSMAIELRAGTRSWRTTVPRRRIEALALRVNGDLAVSATTPAPELLGNLRRAGADADVTLAFAPGRLLVRGSQGLLGSIDTAVEGEPDAAEFEAAPLIAVIEALGPGREPIVVGLTEDKKLRAYRPGDRLWAALLRKDWFFL